ncbi:restriction endonuclease subunit S [Escherichia coli O157:H7]|nr:restriction endonuclease subunit S [Escherichia coli O157:H7]EFB2689822.1 restriction endonuclease subunit S [Escherichia coli O157:H7]EFB2708261.1 restriction endonuclease subunit S [Escherichia coli O157:H7]EFB2717253.1 restriction endonuclease subunit S [Escherichia coli O157:H7]EFB2726077.1 restriction endonuclease subunit S [Escherichia coli O157:H7]
MSVEKLIVDHMETWTSALQTRSTAGRGSSGKIDLYGIKKLRELILELAVRGKLVPQDPNDEPASDLLKRIAAEKAELVKQGKIKKQKPLPEISEEEKPFELPEGWEWTTLTRIAEINPKIDVSDDEQEISFIPMPLISTKFDGSHEFEIKKWKDVKKGYTHFANGDIAIAKITPCFENSKAAIFSGLKNGISVGTTELHVARPFSDIINRKYLLLNFKSPNFLKSGESQMTGSAGQKRVPRLFFENNPIPFPPLQEQERIIIRFTQLMSLCDQLEQQSLTSLDAHQQLVETLLGTLTDSQNAEELAENWTRISEYFDTLFTTEASVYALKQTILQLAVMGKITVPNLSSSTKNKNKTAQNNSILSSLMQYIPAHWNLCTLDQISAAIIDCPHSTPKWTEQGFICVRTNQFKPGHLDLNNSRYVSEQTYIERTQRLEPSYGDILYSREGGILGVACRVPKKVKICLGQRMMLIRPKENISSEYLEFVLNSPLITSLAQQMTTGGAAPRVNVSTVKGYPIPCPPIEEQNQIIRKLNELNGLCEQLRSRIQSAQQTQLHVADALTDAAVN